MNHFTLLIFDEKYGKVYNNGTFDNSIHAIGKGVSIMHDIIYSEIINSENSSDRENYIISEISDREDDGFCFSLSKYENDNQTYIISAVILPYEVSNEEYKKKYQFDPVKDNQYNNYCVLSYINSELINNLGVYNSHVYAVGVGIDYFQSLIDDYNSFNFIKNPNHEDKSYRIINSFDEEFKTECYNLYVKDSNELNFDCSFCILSYKDAPYIIDNIKNPNKLI